MIRQTGPKIKPVLLDIAPCPFLEGTDWQPSDWMVAQTFPYLPVIYRNHDTERPSVQLAQWGLIPHWLKEHDKANQFRNWNLIARGETMFEKPSFRGPAKYHRCIIPVSSFVEWQHRPGEAKAFPHAITYTNSDITFLGGLWEDWGTTTTCCIVTVAANSFVKTIHNGGKNPFRQPVILTPPDFARWLSASTNAKIADLLIPSDSLPLSAIEIFRPASPLEPK